MSIEDRAQEHEARMWEANNQARTGQRVFRPTDPGYGPAECDECGDEMPYARRALAYRRCFSCATAAEKQQQLRR